jgi:hypothetical protein
MVVYDPEELVTLLTELDTILKKLANIIKGLSTIQKSWLPSYILRLSTTLRELVTLLIELVTLLTELVTLPRELVTPSTVHVILLMLLSVVWTLTTVVCLVGQGQFWLGEPFTRIENISARGGGRVGGGGRGRGRRRGEWGGRNNLSQNRNFANIQQHTVCIL